MHSLHVRSGEASKLSDIVLKGSYHSWWRHQMETYSVLLVLCERNSPVTREFPSQRAVTRSLVVSLISAWIHGWVNNREVGEWGRNRAHYDVTVMLCNFDGGLGIAAAQTPVKFGTNRRTLNSYIAVPIFRYIWRKEASRPNDVIECKHFPRNWPFLRGIHRWIPRKNASDAELWCFLWSTVKWTIVRLVISDGVAPIMTSL